MKEITTRKVALVMAITMCVTTGADIVGSIGSLTHAALDSETVTETAATNNAELETVSTELFTTASTTTAMTTTHLVETLATTTEPPVTSTTTTTATTTAESTTLAVVTKRPIVYTTATVVPIVTDTVLDEVAIAEKAFIEAGLSFEQENICYETEMAELQSNVLTEQPTEATEAFASANTTTEYYMGITPDSSDYILLCNCVAYEYGSDWVSTTEKAKVAAVILNRVNSSSYPNSVYTVITQRYQFSGSSNYSGLSWYSSLVTSDVKDAVDWYLTEGYSNGWQYLSFYGDGKRNYFS